MSKRLISVGRHTNRKRLISDLRCYATGGRLCINEYPKVPTRFSMFMTGESTGPLKPYLNISSETSQLNQQRPIEYTH